MSNHVKSVRTVTVKTCFGGSNPRVSPKKAVLREVGAVIGAKSWETRWLVVSVGVSVASWRATPSHHPFLDGNMNSSIQRTPANLGVPPWLYGTPPYILTIFLAIISHYQPLSIIIKHQQSIYGNPHMITIINHHEPSLTIINHYHEPSLTILTIDFPYDNHWI